MSDLTDEWIDAVVRETVDSLPDTLLAHYRNPPGRKPHPHVLRIQSALAGFDDAAATELIRDVVDATVFSLLHLIEFDAGETGIEASIARGSEVVALSGSVLHELYRLKVHPGGAPNRD